MAKYTVDLRVLAETPNYNIFDFDYKLYDDELKPVFEQQFIDHFYFDEIGFETVARFKQRLKAKLNDIYPMYKQLYETELRCKDIDFMLNKDLKESFIREITGNSTSNSTSTSNGNSSVNGTSIDINSDTPQTSIDDIDKYMSSASKNQNNNIANTTDNSTSNNENQNNSREETTLLSQGNIGVTSSAELLMKWRESLININLDMFEELECLFMQIY